MSRIGRLHIADPSTVDVTIDGRRLTVKGPKGTLSRELHPDITVSRDEGNLVVTRPTEQKTHKQLHGLTRTLVNNMVVGVTNGYRKDLEIQGVGYRSALEGKTLVLNVGFSHQVLFPLPDGVSAVVDDRKTKITLSGIDRQLVGATAAKLRSIRPPEPYGGKGVRYADEVVRRKEGKSGAK